MRDWFDTLMTAAGYFLLVLILAPIFLGVPFALWWMVKAILENL